MNKTFAAMTLIFLSACGPNVATYTSGGNDGIKVAAPTPQEPVDQDTDHADQDKGHGNDADKHDEDNPGKGKAIGRDKDKPSRD